MEAQLTTIIMYLGLLAVCSERVAENLKNVLSMDKIANERWRQLAMQSISGFGGAMFSLMISPKGITLLEDLDKWQLFLMMWFLSSGGSSLWHSILGGVDKFKKV